ncbi:hypothetical protein LOAG_09841 [Loa loa]|uniref:Uncharacterized protein n=1 Tax=Loa loa TaxID=7209 RepID=A0A1S0TQW7_LOALO|nr:hypothetical protein LOAG_09841 [Loa loa]EFO18655.1 hypothetical protein LOAG_09841 [Loa loa]
MDPEFSDIMHHAEFKDYEGIPDEAINAKNSLRQGDSYYCKYMSSKIEYQKRNFQNDTLVRTGTAARCIFGIATGITGASGDSDDDGCDAVLAGDLCLYTELYKTLVHNTLCAPSFSSATLPSLYILSEKFPTTISTLSSI